MADNRKAYTVTIGGREHTMLLTDEGAQQYGNNAKLVETKAVPRPANKSRSAQNKK